MIISIQKQHTSISYRVFSAFIAITFIFSSLIPPQRAYAQIVPPSVLNLPSPGTLVPLSPSFNPPIIKGITIHPENPLLFDFIVHPGDDNLKDKKLEDESTKLIKYFMASLTVPEDQMWVNLSPYEKDRIVPQALGETEMGRDLLAQDYLLKQLTASLMYPEDELGSAFWDRVYTRAYEEYGTSEIPLNTFNKIWIMPDTASIYEHGSSVFVVDSHLKVMLEEDYLALEMNKDSNKHGAVGEALSVKSEARDTLHVSQDTTVSSEIIKEIIIPEIEHEVNTGKIFANLRQIYNSVILATWYKQNLKESLLGQVYVDQNKTKGIDIEDKEIKTKIYNQYLEAFKVGVYNYIKEDYDPRTNEMIPRKYFSGGVGLKSPPLTTSSPLIQPFEGTSNVTVKLAPIGDIASSPAQGGEAMLSKSGKRTNRGGIIRNTLIVAAIALSVCTASGCGSPDVSQQYIQELQVSGQIANVNEITLPGGATFLSTLDEVQIEEMRSNPKVKLVYEELSELKIREEGMWNYTATPFSTINRERKLLEWIDNLIISRKDSTQPIVILDWGAGEAVALIELRRILDEREVSNVILIAYGNEYYEALERAPEGIVIVTDVAENLPLILAKYFQDHNITSGIHIYSYLGLVHILFKEYLPHFKQLQNLLAPEGEIRMNFMDSHSYSRNLKLGIPSIPTIERFRTRMNMEELEAIGFDVDFVIEGLGNETQDDDVLFTRLRRKKGTKYNGASSPLSVEEEASSLQSPVTSDPGQEAGALVTGDQQSKANSARTSSPLPAIVAVEKFQGAILGTYVGDALGMPIEGDTHQEILRYYDGPLTDMFASNLRKETGKLIRTFKLPKGHPTDDTAQMFALGEAILDQEGVTGDAIASQIARFRNSRLGYDPLMYDRLGAIEQGVSWEQLAQESNSYGNGAAMRIAPVAIMYHYDFEVLEEKLLTSILVSHRHPWGIVGALLQGRAIAIAINLSSIGPFDAIKFIDELIDYAEILEEKYTQELSDNRKSLYTKKLKIAREFLKLNNVKAEEVIEKLGTGYVAQESVVTAIYAFLSHPFSFENALVYAVNLGGDTDTIGAMTGAISGAYLGVNAIPGRWLDSLHPMTIKDIRMGREHAFSLATRLHVLMKGDFASSPVSVEEEASSPQSPVTSDPDETDTGDRRRGDQASNVNSDGASSPVNQDPFVVTLSFEELDQEFGTWSDSLLDQHLISMRDELFELMRSHNVTPVQHLNWESRPEYSPQDLLWHFLSNPKVMEGLLRLMTLLHSDQRNKAIKDIQTVLQLTRRPGSISDKEEHYSAWKDGIKDSIIDGPTIRYPESYAAHEIIAIDFDYRDWGLFSLDGILQWLLKSSSDTRRLQTDLDAWHRNLLALTQWDLQHRFSQHTTLQLVHGFDLTSQWRQGWQAGRWVQIPDYLYVADGWVLGSDIAVLEVLFNRIKSWYRIHNHFVPKVEHDWILSRGPLKLASLFPESDRDRFFESYIFPFGASSPLSVEEEASSLQSPVTSDPGQEAGALVTEDQRSKVNSARASPPLDPSASSPLQETGKVDYEFQKLVARSEALVTEFDHGQEFFERIARTNMEELRRNFETITFPDLTLNFESDNEEIDHLIPLSDGSFVLHLHLIVSDKERRDELGWERNGVNITFRKEGDELKIIRIKIEPLFSETFVLARLVLAEHVLEGHDLNGLYDAAEKFLTGNKEKIERLMSKVTEHGSKVVLVRSRRRTKEQGIHLSDILLKDHLMDEKQLSVTPRTDASLSMVVVDNDEEVMDESAPSSLAPDPASSPVWGLKAAKQILRWRWGRSRDGIIFGKDVRSYRLSNGARLFTRLEQDEVKDMLGPGWFDLQVYDSDDGGLRVDFYDELRQYIHFETPLVGVYQTLGLDLIGRIKELDQMRQESDDPKRTITILDWGMGKGTALNDILEALGISNVRLVGFGDLPFQAWKSLPRGIDLILDTAENIDRYFKEGEIDLIFSHEGLRHLSNPQVRKNSFRKIFKLMREGGEIIINNFMYEDEVFNVPEMERISHASITKGDVYYRKISSTPASSLTSSPEASETSSAPTISNESKLGTIFKPDSASSPVGVGYDDVMRALSKDILKSEPLLLRIEQIYQEMLKSKFSSRRAKTSWDGGSGRYAPAKLIDLIRLFSRMGSFQGKNFIDLGSGDGRVAVLAALLGAKAIGIEGDSYVFSLAEEIMQRLVAEGIVEPGQIQLLNQDFFDYSISDQDIIFYYEGSNPNTLAVEDKIIQEVTNPDALIVIYGYFDFNDDYRRLVHLPQFDGRSHVGFRVFKIAEQSQVIVTNEPASSPLAARAGDVEIVRPLEAGIEAFVFDWEETIQHSAHIIDELETRMFIEYIYGLQATDEQRAHVQEYINTFPVTLRELFAWAQDQKTKFDSNFREEDFEKEFNTFLRAYIRQAIIVYGRLDHTWREEMPLLVGITQLLEQINISSRPVYVATNVVEEIKKFHAKIMQYDQYFRQIFGAESSSFPLGEYSKVNVLGKVRDTHRLKNNQVAILEDSVSEIRKAVEAGFLGIGVADSTEKAEELKEAGAHIIVHQDFRNFEKLLEATSASSPVNEVDYDDAVGELFERISEDILQLGPDEIILSFMFGLIASSLPGDISADDVVKTFIQNGHESDGEGGIRVMKPIQRDPLWLSLEREQSMQVSLGTAKADNRRGSPAGGGWVRSSRSLDDYDGNPEGTAFDDVIKLKEERGNSSSPLDGLTTVEREHRNSMIITDRLVSLVLKLIKPKDVILDLGIGEGNVSISLAGQIPNKVVGLDNTFTELIKARDRKRTNGLENLKLLASDVRLMPFEDHLFSFVISNLMFPYLDRDEIPKVLKGISRVITPNGHFVFTALMAKPDRREKYGSFEDWQEWLEKSGFTILEVIDNPEDPGMKTIVTRWQEKIAPASSPISQSIMAKEEVLRRIHAMPRSDFIAALRGRLDYQVHRANVPEDGVRPAGVVLLIKEINGKWHYLMTQRSSNIPNLDIWVLPGGTQEDGDRSVQDAAMREFQEEMGVSLGADNILGGFSDYPITSSGEYRIFPFVGFDRYAPKLSPNRSEVADEAWLPFEQLNRPTFNIVRNGEDIPIKLTNTQQMLLKSFYAILENIALEDALTKGEPDIIDALLDSDNPQMFVRKMGEHREERRIFPWNRGDDFVEFNWLRYNRKLRKKTRRRFKIREKNGRVTITYQEDTKGDGRLRNQISIEHKSKNESPIKMALVATGDTTKLSRYEAVYYFFVDEDLYSKLSEDRLIYQVLTGAGPNEGNEEVVLKRIGALNNLLSESTVQRDDTPVHREDILSLKKLSEQAKIRSQSRSSTEDGDTLSPQTLEGASSPLQNEGDSSAERRMNKRIKVGQHAMAVLAILPKSENEAIDWTEILKRVQGFDLLGYELDDALDHLHGEFIPNKKQFKYWIDTHHPYTRPHILRMRKISDEPSSSPVGVDKIDSASSPLKEDKAAAQDQPSDNEFEDGTIVQDRATRSIGKIDGRPERRNENGDIETMITVVFASGSLRLYPVDHPERYLEIVGITEDEYDAELAQRKEDNFALAKQLEAAFEGASIVAENGNQYVLAAEISEDDYEISGNYALNITLKWENHESSIVLKLLIEADKDGIIVDWLNLKHVKFTGMKGIFSLAGEEYKLASKLFDLIGSILPEGMKVIGKIVNDRTINGLIAKYRVDHDGDVRRRSDQYLVVDSYDPQSTGDGEIDITTVFGETLIGRLNEHAGLDLIQIDFNQADDLDRKFDLEALKYLLEETDEDNRSLGILSVKRNRAAEAPETTSSPVGNDEPASSPVESNENGIRRPGKRELSNVEKIRLIEQVMTEVEEEMKREGRTKYFELVSGDMSYVGTYVAFGKDVMNDSEIKPRMSSDKKFGDIGAGIGRMLAVAVAFTDVGEAIGFEMDPYLVEKGKIAIDRLHNLGVIDKKRIRWVVGNWRRSEQMQMISELDVAYIFPPLRQGDFEDWAKSLRPLMSENAYLYDASNPRNNGTGLRSSSPNQSDQPASSPIRKMSMHDSTLYDIESDELNIYLFEQLVQNAARDAGTTSWVIGSMKYLHTGLLRYLGDLDILLWGPYDEQRDAMRDAFYRALEKLVINACPTCSLSLEGGHLWLEAGENHVGKLDIIFTPITQESLNQVRHTFMTKINHPTDARQRMKGWMSAAYYLSEDLSVWQRMRDRFFVHFDSADELAFQSGLESEIAGFRQQFQSTRAETIGQISRQIEQRVRHSLASSPPSKPKAKTPRALSGRPDQPGVESADTEQSSSPLSSTSSSPSTPFRVSSQADRFDKRFQEARKIPLGVQIEAAFNQRAEDSVNRPLIIFVDPGMPAALNFARNRIVGKHPLAPIYLMEQSIGRSDQSVSYRRINPRTGETMIDPDTNELMEATSHYEQLEGDAFVITDLDFSHILVSTEAQIVSENLNRLLPAVSESMPDQQTEFDVQEDEMVDLAKVILDFLGKQTSGRQERGRPDLESVRLPNESRIITEFDKKGNRVGEQEVSLRKVFLYALTEIFYNAIREGLEVVDVHLIGDNNDRKTSLLMTNKGDVRSVYRELSDKAFRAIKKGQLITRPEGLAIVDRKYELGEEEHLTSEDELIEVIREKGNAELLFIYNLSTREIVTGVHGGAGIGLANARMALRAFGGDIIVKQGETIELTTFEVKLDRREGDRRIEERRKADMGYEEGDRRDSNLSSRRDSRAGDRRRLTIEGFQHDRQLSIRTSRGDVFTHTYHGENNTDDKIVIIDGIVFVYVDGEFIPQQEVSERQIFYLYNDIKKSDLRKVPFTATTMVSMLDADVEDKVIVVDGARGGALSLAALKNGARGAILIVYSERHAELAYMDLIENGYTADEDFIILRGDKLDGASTAQRIQEELLLEERVMVISNNGGESDAAEYEITNENAINLIRALQPLVTVTDIVFGGYDTIHIDLIREHLDAVESLGFETPRAVNTVLEENEIFAMSLRSAQVAQPGSEPDEAVSSSMRDGESSSPIVALKEDGSKQARSRPLLQARLTTTLSVLMALCSGACETQTPMDVEDDPIEEVRDTEPDGNYSAVDVFPKPSDTWWGVVSPETVGIDRKGNIYVLDSGSVPLMAYDKDDKLIFEMTSGEIQHGRHIAFDTQNNFYVPQGDVIKVFNEDRSLLENIKIVVPGQTETPRIGDIAIDHNGNMYVVDLNSFRIHKFDSDRNYVLSWGNKGLGQGQFDSHSRKFGIVVDSQGFVYVVDNHYTRIQKFDQNGKFIKQWSTGHPNFDQLVTDSHFSEAFAIANDIIYVGHEGIGEEEYLYGGLFKFDTEGNPIPFAAGAEAYKYRGKGNLGVAPSGEIYVAGSDREVDKLDPDGRLIRVFKSHSKKRYRLFWPVGDALSPNGQIIVRDENEKIAIMRQDLTIETVLDFPKERFPFNILAGSGIAADFIGNIYVAQGKLMFKLSPQGATLAEWSLTESIGRLRFNSKGDLLSLLPDKRLITIDHNNGVVTNEINLELSSHPWDFVFDMQDNIYVATDNGIVKFNSDGQLITEWSYKARINSSVIYGGDGVASMAIDAYGYVYVLFFGADIQIFDPEGNLVNHWNQGEGTQPSNLLMTGGASIHVGSDGLIIIIEHGSSRVQTFQQDQAIFNRASLIGASAGIDLKPEMKIASSLTSSPEASETSSAPIPSIELKPRTTFKSEPASSPIEAITNYKNSIFYRPLVKRNDNRTRKEAAPYIVNALTELYFLYWWQSQSDESIVFTVQDYMDRRENKFSYKQSLGLLSVLVNNGLLERQDSKPFIFLFPEWLVKALHKNPDWVKALVDMHVSGLPSGVLDRSYGEVWGEERHALEWGISNATLKGGIPFFKEVLQDEFDRGPLIERDEIIHQFVDDFVFGSSLDELLDETTIKSAIMEAAEISQLIIYNEVPFPQYYLPVSIAGSEEVISSNYSRGKRAFTKKIDGKLIVFHTIIWEELYSLIEEAVEERRVHEEITGKPLLRRYSFTDRTIKYVATYSISDRFIAGKTPSIESIGHNGKVDRGRTQWYHSQPYLTGYKGVTTITGWPIPYGSKVASKSHRIRYAGNTLEDAVELSQHPDDDPGYSDFNTHSSFQWELINLIHDYGNRRVELLMQPPEFDQESEDDSNEKWDDSWDEDGDAASSPVMKGKDIIDLLLDSDDPFKLVSHLWEGREERRLFPWNHGDDSVEFNWWDYDQDLKRKTHRRLKIREKKGYITVTYQQDTQGDGRLRNQKRVKYKSQNGSPIEIILVATGNTRKFIDNDTLYYFLVDEDFLSKLRDAGLHFTVLQETSLIGGNEKVLFRSVQDLTDHARKTNTAIEPDDVPVQRKGIQSLKKLRNQVITNSEVNARTGVDRQDALDLIEELERQLWALRASLSESERRENQVYSKMLTNYVRLLNTFTSPQQRRHEAMLGHLVKVVSSSPLTEATESASFRELAIYDRLRSTEPANPITRFKTSLWEQVQDYLSRLKRGAKTSNRKAYSTDRQMLALYRKVETLTSGDAAMRGGLLESISEYTAAYKSNSTDLEKMRAVELLVKTLELVISKEEEFQEVDEREKFERFVKAKNLIQLLTVHISGISINDGETVERIVERFRNDDTSWRDISGQENDSVEGFPEDPASSPLAGQDGGAIVEWPQRIPLYRIDPERVRNEMEQIMEAIASGKSSEESVQSKIRKYLGAVNRLNDFSKREDVSSDMLFDEFVQWHRMIVPDSGGDIFPARRAQAKKLIDDLFETPISENNVIDVVSELYFQLIEMHLFDGQGNNRTISLLINFILMKVGLPPFYLTSGNNDAYLELKGKIRHADQYNDKEAVIEQIKEYFHDGVNRERTNSDLPHEIGSDSQASLLTSSPEAIETSSSPAAVSDQRSVVSGQKLTNDVQLETGHDENVEGTSESSSPVIVETNGQRSIEKWMRDLRRLDFKAISTLTEQRSKYSVMTEQGPRAASNFSLASKKLAQEQLRDHSSEQSRLSGFGALIASELALNAEHIDQNANMVVATRVTKENDGTTTFEIIAVDDGQGIEGILEEFSKTTFLIQNTEDLRGQGLKELYYLFMDYKDALLVVGSREKYYVHRYTEDEPGIEKVETSIMPRLDSKGAVFYLKVNNKKRYNLDIPRRIVSFQRAPLSDVSIEDSVELFKQLEGLEIESEESLDEVISNVKNVPIEQVWTEFNKGLRIYQEQEEQLVVGTQHQRLVALFRAFFERIPELDRGMADDLFDRVSELLIMTTIPRVGVLMELALTLLNRQRIELNENLNSAQRSREQFINDYNFLRYLDSMLDYRFLSRYQRDIILQSRKTVASGRNPSEDIRHELDRVLDQVQSIIFIENEVTKLPRKPKGALIVQSLLNHQRLSASLKEQFPGSEILLMDDGREALYKFHYDVAYTEPYFVVIIHESGMPLRLVMKDYKRRKRDIDNVSAHVGNQLLAAINAPIAWVSENNNFAFIYDIRGEDIVDTMGSLHQLDSATQQRLFFAIGIALSEAHILGMSDRPHNMVVSRWRLQKYPPDSLTPVSARAISNIDRENAVNVAYLEKALEQDMHEVIHFIFGYISFLLPIHKQIILHNVPYLLQGFLAGYQSTQDHFSRDEKRVSERIIELAGQRSGGLIIQRLKAPNEQIVQLIKNIEDEVDKKYPGTSSSPPSKPKAETPRALSGQADQPGVESSAADTSSSPIAREEAVSELANRFMHVREVSDGNITFIIVDGPSGAGKTTLLRSVQQDIETKGGNISIIKRDWFIENDTGGGRWYNRKKLEKLLTDIEEFGRSSTTNDSRVFDLSEINEGRKRINKTLTIRGNSIIVVDGARELEDTISKFNFNMKVLVVADEAVARQRIYDRKSRQGMDEETLQKKLSEPSDWTDKFNGDTDIKILNDDFDNPVIIELKRTAEDDSSSPISSSEDIGGIDLNPQSIEMDKRGNGVDFPVPTFDPAQFQNNNIEGFIPIIINVTPITNIPLLLGLAGTEEEPTDLGFDTLDPLEKRDRFKVDKPEHLSLLN